MKFRVFLFILLGIANAFASDLDFTLVNQTARSFEGLYITDSATRIGTQISFSAEKC